MAMSRPEPREADGHEWQTYAPKWLLVTCVGVLVFVAGAMFTEVRYYKDREKARLDAAIADVPSKYQARLSERVASLEAVVPTIVRQVEKSTEASERAIRASERATTAAEQTSRALAAMTEELRKERVR